MTTMGLEETRHFSVLPIFLRISPKCFPKRFLDFRREEVIPVSFPKVIYHMRLLELFGMIILLPSNYWTKINSLDNGFVRTCSTQTDFSTVSK